MMLTLAATVVVLGGMRAIRGIVAGLLLAVVLAVCLSPAQRWLIARRVPRWLAFLLVVGGVLVAIAGLFLLMAVSFAELVNAIPQYSDQLADFQAQAQSALESAGFGQSAATATAGHLADPSMLIDAALGLTQWLVSGVSGFAVMLILFVYMLLDATGFGSRLARVVTPPSYDHFMAFATKLRRFVVLTAIVNFLVALFNTLFLLWMGVDFAVLWGILSFFLGFIPNIGFVLALIGPTIIALLQFGWTEALTVIVVFIIINGAVSNIVQPKLIGTGLDLQPFMVMFSVIFWGFILGPYRGDPGSPHDTRDAVRAGIVAGHRATLAADRKGSGPGGRATIGSQSRDPARVGGCARLRSVSAHCLAFRSSGGRRWTTPASHSGCETRRSSSSVGGTSMSAGWNRKASVCSPPRPPWLPISSSSAATVPSG